jgi:hypothetical protein
MNQGFVDWLFGMLVFGLLALVMFGIGYFMNSYNHFSFLECWGLIMFIVVVRSGVLTWNEEHDEDE